MTEKFDWKVKMGNNIFMLKIMGLWPPGDNTYKADLYSLYSFIFIVGLTYCHTLAQIVNIFCVFPDLKKISGTTFMTLPALLAMIKMYYFVQNMKMLKQIIIDINAHIFKPKNLRQMKIIEPSLNFWKNMCNFFYSMCLLGNILCSTYPILDGSVKKNEFPYPAWYPYNSKISPFYEITYIHQFVSAAFTVFSTLSIDMFIAALNMFIGAQCDILCDDLRHIFNDQGWKNPYIAFLNCIKHHKEILRLAADSNQFFNWIVFIQFFISAVSMGLTMFQLTITDIFSGEYFSIIIYGSAITVQIFLYCWFGNEVELKSKNIPNAIFESKWTSAQEKIKKNMIFFIMRSQRPITMSALNLFSLSIETFMGILRTAWSYFALLHQVTLKT